MERMNNIMEHVQVILSEKEEARNNDRILFYEFYKGHYAEDGKNLDNMTAKDFLLDNYAPNIESVRRSRQKVQERCPWLRANYIIQDIRDEKQEEMRSWARETKGVKS